MAAGAGLLDPFSDPMAGVAAALSAAGCGIGKAGSSLILKGASKLKGSASAATSYGQKVFRVVRTNVTVNTVLRVLSVGLEELHRKCTFKLCL